MKQVILSILVVLTSFYVSLCGCRKKSPNEVNFSELPSDVSFLEFPQYEQFDENIVEIDVAWDMNDSEPVTFSIVEVEDIKTIINMYKATTFVKLDDAIDSNHSYITLTDREGENIIISLSRIKYGTEQQYYAYPDNSINDYIKQIGQNLEIL